MGSITLEVCVDTIDGLETAIQAGADRIELCSALGIGGLTPSVGFMTQSANKGVPMYAMIRPRQGDFVFSADEERIMLNDIAAVSECGLTGVVLGATKVDGSLDDALLERLIQAATQYGLKSVLHRAFDLSPDLDEALEMAIALGFERILTSGGGKDAMTGLPSLARLVKQASGRIAIMPGSGVNVQNVRTILETLRVGDIHTSCSSLIEYSPNNPAVELGFTDSSQKTTDADLIKQFKQLIKSKNE